MASEPHSNAIFYGRFSDGKTAAASDVELKLGAKGIEIKLPSKAMPQVWPYDTLASSEPLTDYAIDALLTSSAAPGATLFAAEGTFARRLAVKAPQLTAKAMRWSHAKPWIAAAVAVVSAGFAVSYFDLSPAHTIATLMPDNARDKIGEHAIQSMTDGRRTCDDAKGLAALAILTKKLSAATGSTADFKVTIVDWGMLNAFAVPGERIITTRRLIQKAESPDEVAGVLAHEMGHGLEMHPETGLVRAIGISAAVELMVGGSGGTLANMGALLATLSYSRDAEREADDHALRILKNAGVSPKGLSAFFKRLNALEGGADEGTASKALDMFSTHPQTAERIAKIDAQGTYPSSPILSDGEWKDLKAICGPPKPGMDEDEDGQDDAPAKAPKDPPKKDKKPDKVEKKAKPKPGRDI